MLKHPTPLLIACSLFLALCFSCSKFEYSPYQSDNDERPEHLNQKNIDRLLSTEASADDTVTIFYTGDSQRFYDDVAPMVSKVNSLPSVDFLILNGDISDFGLLREFLWIDREMRKLSVPYVCTIGNHDLAGKGSEIFVSMYGPKNFSFNYKGYKFLCHDTNGREYGFNGSAPNMWWLSDQLNDSTASWFVGVAHVPPYDGDFDKTLEMPYKNLFSATPNFLAQLNGHLHETDDAYYYNDHVRYINSNSVEKHEAILLKFIHGTIIKQMISY